MLGTGLSQWTKFIRTFLSRALEAIQRNMLQTIEQIHITLLYIIERIQRCVINYIARPDNCYNLQAIDRIKKTFNVSYKTNPENCVTNQFTTPEN